MIFKGECSVTKDGNKNKCFNAVMSYEALSNRMAEIIGGSQISLGKDGK